MSSLDLVGRAVEQAVGNPSYVRGSVHAEAREPRLSLAPFSRFGRPHPLPMHSTGRLAVDEGSRLR